MIKKNNLHVNDDNRNIKAKLNKERKEQKSTI